MSHIAMVKTVTTSSINGDKQEFLFPASGGLSILTVEKERQDGEYYTPVGIEIDISGMGMGELKDPRTGDLYTGVTIHIPADGEKLTGRKSAYRQWKLVMIGHGHHFADVAYAENAEGRTIDAYRWPLKSSATANANQMNKTDTGTGEGEVNVNVNA
jgi:DnaJ-class molecular chaperone